MLFKNEGIKCFPILASQSGLCPSGEFSQIFEEHRTAHSSIPLRNRNQDTSASFDTADYSAWNDLNILDNDTQEALDLLSTFDKDDEDVSISSNVNAIHPSVKVELKSGVIDEARRKQSLAVTSTNSEEV